ncbi:MAG: nucleotidyltransferase domain-containing protein [Desulfobacterales bacterium]|nr:nucleotidyltransferase domain-containing protein [Desulfobacterales bacterium]
MGKISNNIGDKSLAESVQHHLLSYISESGDARETIVAAYLFGSVLRPENFKKNSDIDMAFLLDRRLYKQDPLINSAPAYMAAAEIAAMAERQTDVIILNSASIETAYQAITTGTPVYEADHEHRLEYEALLRGMYFDFKPFLEQLRTKSMRPSGSRGSAE